MKDNGELYMMNVCKDCYCLRQRERKEPVVNGRQWKRRVRLKRWQGKLAAGLGALGFEHEIMDVYAGKEICAKNMLKDAAVAVSLAKGWPIESPHT